MDDQTSQQTGAPDAAALVGTAFSPRDLVLAAPWTSALFTTYSLSLSFFEAIPFSDMSGSVRSVTILADLAGYATSLADAGAVDVGRNYEIVPVLAEGGVFHPKVGILVGKGGLIRAMIGSGNLTFGGWGYNAETCEMLVPGRDSRAYADLAEFLDILSGATGPGRRLKAHRRPDLSPYIDACRDAATLPGGGTSRVLHTLSGPLDAQIAELAKGLGGAEAVTVISPFFSGHHGVARLADALGCKDVSVSVSPNAPSCFDFVGGKAAGLDAKPVMSDTFNGSRSLHAKALDVECRRGRLLVSGSANATLPAMSGRNVEVVLARAVDLAVSVGWRPSGTVSGPVGQAELEDRAADPCLVAHFERGMLVGQVFGISAPAGVWRATLRYGTQAKPLGNPATVTVGGAFDLAPGDFDPTALFCSAQLCLERGGIEVRGWLMHQGLLNAIREKGPIARAVQRMLGGGSQADVIAALEYLAKSPEALLDAARRQGGGREDRRPPAEAASIKLRADLGVPSAFEDGSGWWGAVGEGSFSGLMDALVRRLASVLPELDDEDDEAEEEGSPPSARPRGRTERGERAPKASAPLFRSAFSQMVARLEAVPPGPDRAPGLHLLFDMVVSVAPGCEDGEALTLECLKGWLSLALNRPKRTGPPDALDREIAATLTKLVMDKVAAVECRAKLQQLFEGDPDAATLQLIEPDPLGLDERRLAPGATPEGWKAAWTEMLSAVTSWSRMSALEIAIRRGAFWDAPKEATAKGIALLRRVASGTSRADMLAVMRRRENNVLACPGCHRELTPNERVRLKAARIGSCHWCSRLVLDLGV